MVVVVGVDSTVGGAAILLGRSSWGGGSLDKLISEDEGHRTGSSGALESDRDAEEDSVFFSSSSAAPIKSG